MSSILLIDYDTTGHHLKYAGKLLDELADQYPSFDIDFLTIGKDSAIADYFSEDDVEYLFADRRPVSRRPGTGDLTDRIVNRPMRDVLKLTLAFVRESDYDIIHFLHIDNILQVLWKYSAELKQLRSRVFGSVNGAFFGTKAFPGFLNGAGNALVSQSLSHPAAGKALQGLPNLFSYRRPWKDAFLSHLLRTNTFDYLFVPTESGKRYIGQFGDADITVVPDPTEVPDCEVVTSRKPAREALRVCQDTPVLLFFGELRDEKGIKLLLDGLRTYDGQPFTMVIAGKPIDVDFEEVESVRDNPALTVRADLGYIEESEVANYFAACDGVVLPYAMAFGEYRPSNVLNQSCSYGRPVIAPNFGVFTAVTTEWDVGVTYTPENRDSLVRTIDEFVGAPDQFSPGAIRDYARTQTYGQLAAEIGGIYQSTI